MVRALRRAGGQGNVGGGGDHRAAEAVGDDQAGALGQDVAGEFRRHGE